MTYNPPTTERFQYFFHEWLLINNHRPLKENKSIVHGLLEYQKHELFYPSKAFNLIILAIKNIDITDFECNNVTITNGHNKKFNTYYSFFGLLPGTSFC